MNDNVWVQLPNGQVGLNLNPNSRYSVLKIINDQRQVLLAHNLSWDNAQTTVMMIYDNETPLPNVRYIIEQE